MTTRCSDAQVPPRLRTDGPHYAGAAVSTDKVDGVTMPGAPRSATSTRAPGGRSPACVRCACRASGPTTWIPATTPRRSSAAPTAPPRPAPPTASASCPAGRATRRLRQGRGGALEARTRIRAGRWLPSAFSGDRFRLGRRRPDALRQHRRPARVRALRFPERQRGAGLLALGRPELPLSRQAVAGTIQVAKQTYDLPRDFLSDLPELPAPRAVIPIECVALPASLPERVQTRFMRPVPG